MDLTGVLGIALYIAIVPPKAKPKRRVKEGGSANSLGFASSELVRIRFSCYKAREFRWLQANSLGCNRSSFTRLWRWLGEFPRTAIPSTPPRHWHVLWSIGTFAARILGYPYIYQFIPLRPRSEFAWRNRTHNSVQLLHILHDIIGNSDEANWLRLGQGKPATPPGQQLYLIAIRLSRLLPHAQLPTFLCNLYR